MLERLASTEPTTLACMHGSAWHGNGAKILRALGDMLMESGKPAQAMLEYESVLEIASNRLNSLYGAGHAAELAGNPGRAKRDYSKLIQNSEKGNSSRPVINQVLSFLAKG